ncbi:origin recognition complex, subunit 6 [Dactylonectria estremocensis]|uniref:Origin recognition complex, subunit 6 n=1 Tax=Dactylonectria estremocensis TaxID=1079267 RepID=A0A9P9E9X1_9HYPO|nr:origin recognition complex, subunit 6 [Dactylonectria estremocensis]
MSRQIDQALLSLMPTYTQDLPPTLLELANSLLAQSRHRASMLKAEEEVARLYACANIACDRLKITLDLPPIEPRPPIPPRIYKRLYAHLDNILPHPGSTPRTPSGRVRTPSARLRELGSSPGSATRVPSRATPTKERSLAQWRTPSKAGNGTPTKSASKTTVSVPENGLHPWIQPVTRFICQETNHKRLAPTILAGMEVILTPGGRKTEDEWVLQNVTAWFAAIYFFVTQRLLALESGEMLDRDGYIPKRKEILALLARARKEVTILGLEDDDAWNGWNKPKVAEFDDAVAQVTNRNWLEGDWYLGIADVAKLAGRSQIGDVDMVDEEAMPTMQIKRTDTMFQDKYDFLSETKCADHRVWKDSMLAKIVQLTATGAAMDLDKS